MTEVFVTALGNEGVRVVSGCFIPYRRDGVERVIFAMVACICDAIESKVLEGFTFIVPPVVLCATWVEKGVPVVVVRVWVGYWIIAGLVFVGDAVDASIVVTLMRIDNDGLSIVSSVVSIKINRKNN